MQIGELVSASSRSPITPPAPVGADDVRCQAHDLRNKLQIVVGYCDVLLAPAEPLTDRHRAVRMIANIRTAAQDSARIASAIMSPPGGSPAVGEVDLNALLLEEVGALCQDLLRQDINVLVERTPLLPAVRVDELWLARTVLNLAHNARDAILGQAHRSGSGIIRFRTSVPPVATAVPCVLLTVADNGPGIEAAILERIWEPGFSTKTLATTGSRGYGLASVRAFAEEAGGFVDVDSQPGQGTEFSLALPAVDPRG